MKSTYTFHSEQFTGATVIDPVKGYYTEPVATLDFSSLYPSIMVAHNLCYTTLVPEHTLKRWKKKKVKMNLTPNGDYFVDPSVRKGILPRILEDIVAERTAIRQ